MSPDLGLTGTWWDIAATFSGPIAGIILLVVFIIFNVGEKAWEPWEGEE